MQRFPRPTARLRSALTLLVLTGTSALLANEATLTLTSLSMKVPTASVNLLGSVYRLSFTTADDDTVNGELFASEGTGTYTSNAILEYPGSEALGPLIGLITLDIPLSGDTNVNGITDFLEVDRAIGATATTGTIEIDDGMEFSQGTVAATWRRNANEATGTVELRVNLPDFGFQSLTFNHTFEIFQYRGVLTYTRNGDDVTATVNLPRRGAAGAFTGSMPMTRVSNGELSRAPVTWKGPGNLDFELFGTDDLEDVPLPVNYIARDFYGGLIILADGDPSTPFPDEYDYFDLLIEDPNDADNDGLPDLSDTISAEPERPTLATSFTSNAVQIEVTGTPGAPLVIESSPTLPATTWTTAGEVTLNASGKATLSITDLSGNARLFRARTP
jgi:hypothetical protein